MNDDIKNNLKQTSSWIRGLYMLLFTFLAGVADFVLFGIVIFQFVHNLFCGETNERLRKLGQSIATYVYQVVKFLTFNSDYHPYPLGAWPKGEPKATNEVTK
jgi:hypothetical protein